MKLNQWFEVAPMLTARTFLATAVLSGTLFAIGGRNAGSCLNSVEYYVPGVNKWVSIAPMNAKRSYHQAGVANNILFVFGGYDGKSLKTLEKYSPAENKWTLVIVLQNCKSLRFQMTSFDISADVHFVYSS